MKGWAKIPRDVFDHPIIGRDPDYLSVWIWLLCNAAFEERPGLLGGKPITLKPGQLTAGRKQIAAQTGVEESKVRRILKLFVDSRVIDQQTTNKNSLFSMLWPDFVEEGSQEMDSKRPTDDQRVTTLKEKRRNTEDFFVRFWEAYPKKQGKKSALRAFDKVDVSIDVLLSALEEQKRSSQWTKDNGQFIPLPATWLNGRRWEDELEAGQAEEVRKPELTFREEGGVVIFE